MTGKD